MATITERAKEKAEEMRQETLPEAVASVSYSLITPNGFPIIFTLRGNSEGDVINRMEVLEEEFVNGKYEPDIKYRGKGGSKPVAYTGENCPKCNGKLIDKEKLVHCENYKFDFKTKSNVGTCDYKVWKDGDTSEPATSAPESATPKQKQALIANDLWVEGMTKAEAFKVLQGLYGTE